MKNAEKFKVILPDRCDFVAKIVGADPNSDVVVLKININKSTILNLGDSSKLEVDECALAAGNPFDISHTLTRGAVSATGINSLGINDY